ncbi:neuropeptide F receptor-like [Ischnura elegans]|uniref:neuropeptide F receptor-like n=1 Tax=Ischnura elegans TaxID=197161 RepID=UPI001ED8722E|nr:neuropeptide F receptor-like [Ischnura elegans]
MIPSLTPPSFLSPRRSLDDGTRQLARRTQQCSSAPRCDARTRVLASVALIWLLALAAAVPVALFQQVERLAVGGVVVFEACVERWPSRSARAAYSVCVATAQFAVPAVVLAAVHARISARLRAGSGVAAPRRRCRAAARRRRHRRTTLILSAVAAVFAASWLPLTVFSLVSDLSAPRPHPIHAAAAPPQPLLPPHGLYAAFAACHVAAMTSACSNPFLYGWLNTNFRREFAEIVPGACAGRRRGEAASSSGGRRDARRTSSTLVTALSGRPATVSCLPSVSQAGRSELL